MPIIYRKAITLTSYILVNLLTFIMTRSTDYFGMSAGLTTLTLAVITKLFPDFNGFKFKDNFSFLFMIVAGFCSLLIMLI